ncbi:MAG: efflux RND transporter periplasmic adaptor subunit, partial [Balneolales bacterium]
MKRASIWSAGIIILAGSIAAFVYRGNGAEEDDSLAAVTVETGHIIEKALAVGTIEPENEVEVKSKISGVVNVIYMQPGTYVNQGDPLIEVRPEPTPLELAEAKRNLELSQTELDNLKRELDRAQHLQERNLVSDHDYESLLQRYNDARIREQMNQERLQLLESGRIEIGSTLIESVIKAPISGYILEKMVNIGDPVVPLTSYQAGTPLMTIASMEQLLFKGTVDEIDVGKLEEGMPVEIKIGALPGSTITGELSTISLKATKEENTTVFPVEITITDAGGTMLRAGFSANADIIINRKEDILVIPERIVTFRDGKSYIEVPGSEQ